MNRIVWVLGAGFSKPLGGPLLGDLFTSASKGNLEARFPRERYPRLHVPAAALVRWMYRFGQGLEVTGAFGMKSVGERIWENAEEFLEYLDTAVALGGDSPGWRRLEPIVRQYTSTMVVPGAPAQPSFGAPEQQQHVADTARRLMGAECCAFLPERERDQPSLERWKPYQAWWRKVEPVHRIISFNYDLLVERLNAVEPRKLYVVPPAADALPKDVVPLIKLHGSVNWRCLRGTGVPDKYETGQPDDFVLTCEDYELAIASPGLTKQRMVSDDLMQLWRLAEQELAAADAIVFVGYRFPPTDSEALARLLGAIGGNDNLYLALHTVLGPKKSDDVVRLHALLRYAARVRKREHTSRIGMDAVGGQGVGGRRLYTLVSQELWAQDFLLVAQPHEILQPYLVNWD